MTLAEKKNLKTLIQKLPSGSLDRVVEIIKRHKQAEEGSCDEVSVDLEQQVEAVINFFKIVRISDYIWNMFFRIM